MKLIKVKSIGGGSETAKETIKFYLRNPFDEVVFTHAHDVAFRLIFKP